MFHQQNLEVKITGSTPRPDTKPGEYHPFPLRPGRWIYRLGISSRSLLEYIYIYNGIRWDKYMGYYIYMMGYNGFYMGHCKYMGYLSGPQEGFS